jgi:plastocyanin
MMHRHGLLLSAALFALATSSVAVIASDSDKDKDTKAPMEAVVQFAHLVSPAPAAGSLAGTLTHFLNPDDVTIGKGGIVTFVINNGGHGLAIYPVAKKTTRDDIAEDLCQGPPGTAESDRAARFTVCGGAQANLNYDITDGNGDLIIRTGTNVQRPRLDDPTNRLLGTSGAVRTCGPGESEPTCDSSVLAANGAGGFLTGNVIAIPANPTATPPTAAVAQAIGNRIVYQFNKTGRYLVICMNRAHSLNDHMFGFVNVVGDDDN